MISQYRTHMYDTVDDPEELKSHLVFNEAQYFALKGFYEDEINNKEAEIISLKKNNLQSKDENALLEENSRLRRELTDEKCKYEVMESGYKAVKQYLEDGTGFRRSKELEVELEQLKKKYEQSQNDIQYWKMCNDDLVSENNSLQDQLHKKKEDDKISVSSDSDIEVILAQKEEERKLIEREYEQKIQNNRETVNALLIEAEEKIHVLEEENAEMKDTLKLYSIDLELEDLTPEEAATIRYALSKQAKIYRQREKELLKRIKELEDEISEPIDIRTAIDEAVHEVVKRASENQMRLKAENAALKKRISQLEQDADDDFENIEDVVKNSIEMADMDKQDLSRNYEEARSALFVSNQIADGLMREKDKNQERLEESRILLKQMEEELNEKEALIVDMEKNAIYQYNRGNKLADYVKKYAALSGLSEEEIRYLLFEEGRDEGDDIEVLSESNYVYDARIKGITHYTPEKTESPTFLYTEQSMPRRLVNDMDEMSKKLFEYQRQIKKLTFENKRMKNCIEQHNLTGSIGLNAEEMAELDKLHDQFWSDKSDLIQEINDLRITNANLQDQIDHLPTEARLYRESIIRSQVSTEQVDEETPLGRMGMSTRYGPSASTVYAASRYNDSELAKRNRELEQRYQETKSELQKANEEFNKLCQSLENGNDSSIEIMNLTRTVRELTELKNQLEKENQEKDTEIADIRAIVASKERQLEEKQKQANYARELAEKKNRDYEEAQENVTKLQQEIDELKKELKEKQAIVAASTLSHTVSDNSDSDSEEIEALKKELEEKEKELNELREKRNRSIVDASESNVELANKLQELEKENEALKN